MSPAGPAPTIPTWVSSGLRMLGAASTRIRLALPLEAFVGVNHEAQHPQQLCLLAVGEHRDQHSVHPHGALGEALGGAKAGYCEAEPIAAGIARIPKANDQPASGQARNHLGCG